LTRSPKGVRTAGIGASCPLESVRAKVGLLNRLPTFHLGGGNRSSCPIPAIGQHNPDRGYSGEVSVAASLVNDCSRLPPRRSFVTLRG
jgi:hypothetical protein